MNFLSTVLYHCMIHTETSKNYYYLCLAQADLTSPTIGKEGKTPSEAELLDEIQTKVLRVLLLVIHSHPSTALLEISISSNSLNLLQFLYSKGERRKTDRKPYLLPYGLRIHTETSSLRTLESMTRNLNDTVSSRVPSLYMRW